MVGRGNFIVGPALQGIPARLALLFGQSSRGPGDCRGQLGHISAQVLEIPLSSLLGGPRQRVFFLLIGRLLQLLLPALQLCLHGLDQLERALVEGAKLLETRLELGQGRRLVKLAILGQKSVQLLLERGQLLIVELERGQQRIVQLDRDIERQSVLSAFQVCLGLDQAELPLLEAQIDQINLDAGDAAPLVQGLGQAQVLLQAFDVGPLIANILLLEEQAQVSAGGDVESELLAKPREGAHGVQQIALGPGQPFHANVSAKAAQQRLHQVDDNAGSRHGRVGPGKLEDEAVGEIEHQLTAGSKGFGKAEHGAGA